LPGRQTAQPKPLFHSCQVAQVKTLQLMAGNAHQRIVLARLLAQLHQLLAKLSAIAAVLIAHHHKTAVGVLPMLHAHHHALV